jgi:hypothetical protein
VSATCQIQWIDDDGAPTPDSKPAIGSCWTLGRRTLIHGRLVSIPESQHYLICEDHARQLSEPDMNGWAFEPLSEPVR